MAPYLKPTILILIVCIHCFTSQAQVLTSEDSLAAGITKNDRSTVLSGYGEAKYQYDTRYQVAEANLTRAVLFIGHRFNQKISFFSELELEDGKITGGEPKGELAFEQLYLKFNLNKSWYITAGLFVPRIGITNENHLPNTYSGNDRSKVETLIIPATWRELGIGLYGTSQRIAGLNYSIALLNGLNAAGFESGTGIREGRYEGQNASATSLAVTGALLYYVGSFRLQLSGYIGGSAGLPKRAADSLQLTSGAFGTPVMLGEANIQYNKNGFQIKALATSLNIPDAAKINLAYANNTAKILMGAYFEAGYNLLKLWNSPQNLSLFARYEFVDMNYSLPKNGITDGTLTQQYLISGLTYQPIKNVAVKLDAVFKTTGDQNPALIIHPFPTTVYYKTNTYINLGFGYSF
jgi:hypothetical protein